MGRLKSLAKKRLSIAKSKVSRKSVKKAFSFTDDERKQLSKLKKKLPKPSLKKVKTYGSKVDFRRLLR